MAIKFPTAYGHLCTEGLFCLLGPPPGGKLPRAELRPRTGHKHGCHAGGGNSLGWSIIPDAGRGSASGPAGVRPAPADLTPDRVPGPGLRLPTRARPPRRPGQPSGSVWAQQENRPHQVSQDEEDLKRGAGHRERLGPRERRCSGQGQLTPVREPRAAAEVVRAWTAGGGPRARGLPSGGRGGHWGP